MSSSATALLSLSTWEEGRADTALETVRKEGYHWTTHKLPSLKDLYSTDDTEIIFRLGIKVQIVYCIAFFGSYLITVFFTGSMPISPTMMFYFR